MERTPAWGIEPVPDRLRVLGLLDTGLLWGSLGVSLLVLVAGTYLVPALSLPKALLAILVGSLIGNAMLGARRDDRRGRARAGDGADAGAARAAGLVGADAAERRAVRGLGDLRAADHRDRRRRALRRAVRIPRAVALDARLRRRRRSRSRCSARSASSGASCASSRSGPCSPRCSTSPGGRSTAPASAGSGTARARAACRSGRASTWSSRSRSRGCRSPPTTPASAATAGARSGGRPSATSLPSLWLWGLGAVLFFSRDLTDPAALPAAVAAGGLAATLALLAVTVDETDEAFANVYSAAVSTQNLVPAAAAARAHRRRGGGRHGRRADDRPALLPDLPASARLVLRAALRRAARGLARGARLTTASRTSSPGRASAPG